VAQSSKHDTNFSTRARRVILVHHGVSVTLTDVSAGTSTVGGVIPINLADDGETRRRRYVLTSATVLPFPPDRIDTVTDATDNDVWTVESWSRIRGNTIALDCWIAKLDA